MNHGKTIILSLIVILMTVPFAHAAEEDRQPCTLLTLEQAIDLAVTKNPALKALTYENAMAEARGHQNTRLPNPELSVEVEDFGGTGELKESDALETTIVLSQVFQLGGKRKKQHDLSTIEQDLVTWDIQTQKMDLITEVRKAFIEVLGAQELVSLSRELISLEEKVYRSVDHRVRAGKVSPLEEIKAEASLAASKIDLKRAERTLLTTKKQLAALWGEQSLSFDAVEGELGSLRELPPFETLSVALMKNPDMARWSNELDRRRAAVSLEKANRFPDIEIGAGWRDFNESDDHAFLVGLTLPLQLFDRNQGNLREALQGLAQAEQEKLAHEISIRTQLASIYDETTITLDEATALMHDIVPAMEKVFVSQQEGYRLGKFSYLTVLDAQRSFFESRRKLLEALISYQQSLADLDRLVGAPVNQDNHSM